MQRLRQAALALTLVCLACSSCSTLSFSRKDAVFDGTVHALSSLVCAGYWADRDWQRESLDRSLPARTGVTFGLIGYGLVDLSFSVIGDLAFLVPNAIIRGGPAQPMFEVRDHARPWRCGSLQHSIHVVGAL